MDDPSIFDRDLVEDLLSDATHPDADYERVEASTLAALCRAWLALDAGAPAIMDTRAALSVCAPTEDDFPALYALQGQRVRIVPVEGDHEQND